MLLVFDTGIRDFLIEGMFACVEEPFVIEGIVFFFGLGRLPMQETSNWGS